MTIRYVALGDSYTIGEGAKQSEAWPVLLATHLQQNSIPVELVLNPSRTGYTTEEVITIELPLYQSSKPGFATLLIGVNDWVQGVSQERFRDNFAFILEAMKSELPDKNNLLVITIPDFSATPNGQRYASGRNISKGIAEFNVIITEEARKRNLIVVDIYALSQEMNRDPTLVAKDGLHPSAKEYAIWEAHIYEAALKILNEQ